MPNVVAWLRAIVGVAFVGVLLLCCLAWSIQFLISLVINPISIFLFVVFQGLLGLVAPHSFAAVAAVVAIAVLFWIVILRNSKKGDTHDN